MKITFLYHVIHSFLFRHCSSCLKYRHFYCHVYFLSWLHGRARESTRCLYLQPYKQFGDELLRLHVTSICRSTYKYHPWHCMSFIPSSYTNFIHSNRPGAEMAQDISFLSSLSQETVSWIFKLQLLFLHGVQMMI